MKYNFNKEIQEKLKSFKNYLQKLGYGENSVLQKSNYAGCFLEWLINERLTPGATRYNDLLNFIDYCRLENNSIKLINNKLRSIRNYYEYLKKKRKPCYHQSRPKPLCKRNKAQNTLQPNQF